MPISDSKLSPYLGDVIKCFFWSFCENTRIIIYLHNLLSFAYRKWMLLGLSWLKEISKLKWGFVSTYFFLFYPYSGIFQGPSKAVLTSLWTKKTRAACWPRRVGDCAGFLFSIACALLLLWGIYSSCKEHLEDRESKSQLLPPLKMPFLC